jgi:ElaB/YqjD/DUF883 family membrane-anchored ribosome-binding protein
MNNAATTNENSPSALLASLGEDVKTRIDEVTVQAKKRGFMTLMQIKQFVEKNPFQSLAIAFGVGYAFKLLSPGVVKTAAVVGGAGLLGKKLGLQ